MLKRIAGVVAGVLALSLLGSGQADSTPSTRLVERLFPIPSPTGYEHLMAREIQDSLPAGMQFSRDNLGSLTMEPKTGAPRIAVLVGMDEIGYAVSGITEEGYLMLDRGVRPPHALYDTYQVGHPVRIWTQKGRVDGVWTLPSSHTLSRARRMTLMQELTLEHAYVDIGAGSREAAELRGIAYLDPVTPAGSLHGLAGGQLSGPALGTKSCAGLVLGLAGNVEEAPGLSDVQFVWLAQCRLLRRTGGRTVPVGALRARKDMAAGEVLLVDTFPVRDSDPMEIRPGMGPVLVGGGDGSALYGRLKRTAEEEGIPVQESREYTPATLIPFLDGESDAAAILLPVRFPATPSEVIWESDLEAMQRLLLAVSVKGDPR